MSSTTNRMFLAAFVLAISIIGIVMVEDSEENDAVTEYPVTIFYHPNATITFDGTTVTYPNSSEPYGYGDPVTITATIATGYTFDHWYGNNITEGEDWTADSSSQYITISGNVVTYQTWCYGEEEYTLYLSGGTPTTYTVTFEDDGWGTIDLDSAPLADGNTLTVPYGTHFYISGDSITFTMQPYAQFVYAEPNPDFDGWHYFFDSWNWNEGDHTVTDNITLKAYFDRSVARYTVSFAAGTGGSVSPASVPNVPYNTIPSINGNQIQLFNTTVVATPNPGYEFSSWSNAVQPITGARTITANFTQIQTYTVTINYNSSYGTVSPSTLTNVPSGAPISSSGNVLTVGSQTATATPKTATTYYNYYFSGWTDATGTVTSNKTVTANFYQAPKDFPMTVFYHPNATITIGGPSEVVPPAGWSDEFQYGSQVTITAVMDTYYTFDYWYGNDLTEGEDWRADSTSPYISINGQTVTYTAYVYGETEYTLHLSGGTPATCTVTFVASPSDYGHLTNTTVTTAYGSIWTLDGNNFLLNGSVVTTAVPTTSGGGYTYAFDSWSRGPTGTIVDDTTVTAYFTRTAVTYTVTINYNSDYGTVSPSTLTNVPSGASISSSGNVLTVGSQTATATPKPATINYSYSFGSWSIPEQTVTGNMTINANFIRSGTLYPQVVYANSKASMTVNGESVTGATWADEMQYGSTIRIVAVMDAGYFFDHVHIYDVTEGESYDVDDSAPGITVAEQTVTIEDTIQGETQYTVVLTGGPMPQVTVTFVSSPPSYGSFTHTTVTVDEGSIWTISGADFKINGVVVSTALPNPDTIDYDYSFIGWSRSGSGTIYANDTVTAYFTRTPLSVPDVWWYNGYTNGSVNIAFDFVTTSNNYSHTMTIPLVEYDGIKDDVDGIDYFSESPYILEIVVSYNSNIVCTLTGNGQAISNSFKSGSWVQFTLDVDAQKGTVTFNGTRSLGWNANRDFTFLNYETVFTQKIFDFSSEVTGLAISKIYHEDTGNGMNHPRFQVSATTTFLDTYGFVMIDPTLNIYSQFPNYDNLRLNLYSFAVYGETMTVNGHQFTLQGSRLSDLYYTVYTDEDDNEHYVIANASTEGAVKYDATLSNIYITWTNITLQTAEDRQCYLTFADDKKTIEMGSYPLNDLMISFTGIWYFTTALYEPYTAHETVYSMDWGSWFNLSGDAFLLIIAGLLIILTVAFSMIWKPSIIDYAIIIGSGLISYILIGGL